MESLGDLEKRLIDILREKSIQRGRFQLRSGKWSDFYVDGKETWRTRAGGVCQAPLYIKLSDEIGEWGGDIAKAKLPDRFLVDYVRVYDLVKADDRCCSDQELFFQDFLWGEKLCPACSRHYF